MIPHQAKEDAKKLLLKQVMLTLISDKMQFIQSRSSHEFRSIVSDSSSTQMPISDIMTLVQKMTNADYLQKVTKLKRASDQLVLTKRDSMLDLGAEEKSYKKFGAGKRGMLVVETTEIGELDKEKIKKRKIEVEIEGKKEKDKQNTWLAERQLAELESGKEECMSQIAYFIKANSLVMANVPSKTGLAGGTVLTQTDIKLLGLIINKHPAQMYHLISLWLYQEYHLYLSLNSEFCLTRYEHILSEFFNSVEAKSNEDKYQTQQGMEMK